LPVTETHSFNPKDPYGVSKAAADAYCRYAHRAFGADVIIARPFNHSGPGQSDSFVISNFAKQVAEIEAGRREPVIEVGDLSARRDFLHVDDVIDVYLLLAERGSAGEAYNICSGESHSAQDVLGALLALVDVEVKVRTDTARMRPVDVPDIVGSHAKLTRDTGWQPVRTFQTLIEDVLNYWRKAIVP
jgi:GDP-4-dehydro-6-deoxy-D-mannose reductase